MKKPISILLMLLITILMAVLAHASYKSEITTAVRLFQENADETNFTGKYITAHPFANFTDGDLTTYASTNGTFLMNYTKRADYTISSLWQMKYNTSTGVRTSNHSIPSACWNYYSNKIELKVNTSSTSNARYCYSGSWTIIGAIETKQAIYEEAMHWNVGGVTYNLSYYLEQPAEYVTFDKTTINFSIYINDTAIDENHTTFNVSIYTRMNNTAAYTINVSDLVLTNGSFINATINFNDGDRVWWYWNIEDNYSRTIANTSVRIFDVDLVYYTFSLGVGKYINFSLDSGEILTAGGITAANITLTDGRITSNLMNLSSAGELAVAGGITGANLTLRDGSITSTPMNLTSAGELVVAGGITGANYTAGTSTGFSGQLNITNTTECNITVTGGIITAYAGC